MKTVSFLRFFLVMSVTGLFLFQPVFAGVAGNNCATTLWKNFQGNINYPEFAHKQALQGEVTVVFNVSNDGGIVIRDVRSTDSERVKYIRQVIESVKCPELENATEFDFKLNFISG
jgi:outer membrane biosynthesis protein TonB